MPPIETGTDGKRYWRSLDEYANSPEFQKHLEREFPSLVPDLLSESSRRSFLKLMGASAALAGLAGCRWPRETIVPYAHRPEGRTPGQPVYYATAMDFEGAAVGLLAKSFDGRPIKIEGNPEHPGSLGKTNLFHQASVLDLYDPDRCRSVVKRDRDRRFASSWADFDAFARDQVAALAGRNGEGLAVLVGSSSSPSRAEMRRRLERRFPRMRWTEYEPISRDSERAGSMMALGRPYRARLSLDRAEVIVSLDADLLNRHPDAVRNARDFARGRTGENGHMNRLYAVESAFSLTGGMADHRFPVQSGRIIDVTFQIARKLLLQGVGAGYPAGLSDVISGWSGAEFDFVDQIVADLIDRRGRSVIVAGPRQPAEVHALCHALNRALGNVGATIAYTDDPDGDRPVHVSALAELVRAMTAGQVKTLVILGGNPAFTAPSDLGFADAMSRVETSVHLAHGENETSRLCTWTLPAAHYLESWGDARAYDGTISVVQPLIAPLYDGRTEIEILAGLMGDAPRSAYDVVRETARAQLSGRGDFETIWRKVLHDGVIPDTAWPRREPGLAPTLTTALRSLRPGAAADDAYEVVFVADAKVYDGRFANNGWLQELPDPMSKITWDNAAIVGTQTARELGIEAGDLIRLSRGDREIEIAAYVMPGQAPRSIALPLGYGRTDAGRVGNGVGVNTYALRTSDATDVAAGVQVVATGGKHLLAVTQDHHAIDRVGYEAREERLGELYREATFDHYQEHPDFAAHVTHHPPLKSLWKEHEYNGYRWGMGIDLSVCTGCSACVVACQAENNIPIVGKKDVSRGREMHWIRIDRYFVGEPEEAEVGHQPVACHHCENAPCESVCPVAATVHDAEGLNVMVYNRCVGTRYCANNCPYKVRRFNYFNYQKHLPETKKMLYNPDVTVRSRGVMEKCSFCVQRINAAKFTAKNEGRAVRDGEIVPACAQACPTDAIVFGDLNDPQSRIARWHAHQRAYAMLSELNVKPRTKYLAKLRNPVATGDGHEDPTEHHAAKEPGHS